jgi:DNA repair exonuclease SbcCD ATPase subunit
VITFKKLRYKNFLSSGNQFTEIDFLAHKTNLIIGTNGAGKSTCLDALTFTLFNKAFRRINKNQLVNTTNEKDCLVEIEFSINNRDYLVRRGIKPNIFDIEVNGVSLHKEEIGRAHV